MSDGKKTDHWGILAVNIGAKSAEELSQAETAGEPISEAGASAEGALAENVSETAGPSFVSSPPAYTPPRQQTKQPPKPRGSQFGSGWDKLAGEFGLEVPPPPPAKPVDEPTYQPAAYTPPKYEPVSHELPVAGPLPEELAEVDSAGEDPNHEHPAAETDRPPRSRTRSRHSARSERPNGDRSDSRDRSRQRRDQESRESTSTPGHDSVVFDEDAVEFRDEFVEELGSLNEEFNDDFDPAAEFGEVIGDEADRDHGDGSRGESDSEKSRPRRRRRRRGRGRGREAGEGERPGPRGVAHHDSEAHPDTESGAVHAEDSTVVGEQHSDDARTSGNESQRHRRGGRNRSDRGPKDRVGQGRRPEHGRYSEAEPIDQDELADEYDDLGDDLLEVAEGHDTHAEGFDEADHGDGDSGHDDQDFHDDEGGEDDDVESPRIGFRNIPTWHEAVGVLVSKNMESRTRNPGGNRGYGGGNRGGRGGRGRGRGRPDKR